MDKRVFNKTVLRYKESTSLPEQAPVDEKELQDVDRELFEERAAIIEFDAGMSRVNAERIALNDWKVVRSGVLNRQRRALSISTAAVTSQPAPDNIKVRLEKMRDAAVKAKSLNKYSKPEINIMKAEMGCYDNMGIPF